MLNAFYVWLSANWDAIVIIFMWVVTLLMGFVIVGKVYKIIRIKFETVDAVELFIAGAWIMLIIFFGFDHIRLYLQNLL
jgi:hypothetical protein